MTLSLQALGYRYPSAASPALDGLTVEVAAGEVVLLTGPTGCGKSTALRLAAGLLQRHGAGAVQGAVSLDGQDPAAMPPHQRVRRLGFVSQEPGDQLVSRQVGDELAFAMESAGLSAAEMEARIPALLEAVGLAVGPERDTLALSGGQVQRLVTGAALSAGAQVLLLDEPLANLDPDGAAALMGRLRGLADHDGVAVLVVEHRLEACLPFLDRVVILAEGRVVAQGPARQLAPGLPLLQAARRLGLSVPGPLDLADRLAPRDPDDAAFMEAEAPVTPTGSALWTTGPLQWRYPGGDGDALRAAPLTLRAGERVALVGGNGAGKSTLLGLLSGALAGARPPRGLRVIAIPQDPDLALFCPTARDELAYGPREQRLPPTEVQARVAEAAAALSVGPLLDRPPQALSRGQRLRVAVAAAVACAPDLLLLDEPTAGQDHGQVEHMMAALTAQLSGGVLVFATHDLGLALRHATRALVLDAGRVLRDGPPAEVLADLPATLPLRLPPLAAWCMARGLRPDTAEALAARVRP
ncbi:MAG: ATP-binding cassette domain-containing protein [Alphaproteobacteria bacterium]|nr:ATP-binding cassette domain-containing protein [Alphaproteobacteria bacterium]